jgi:two-component system phosphate regulon sensor histidine kinase PhoR
VFYAWIGLIGQVVFLVGAVVFVLVGASYQRSAIEANSRAQRLQLANLALQGSFLDALRSTRGYLLTSQDRFLQSYYTDRMDFVTGLSLARGLAWPGAVGGLDQEGSDALAAFQLADRARASPSGSPRSQTLFSQASNAADRFANANARLQALLERVGGASAAASQRSLGIGLVGTSIVLTVGLMIPLLAAGYILRWTIIPVLGATDAVRRLAAGDHAARAVPGGPVEVHDLSLSIDVLADESDRLRAEQEEVSRLSALVRETAMRVREHLDAEDVVREAVAAIEQNLECDYVWVGLVSDGKLTLPVGNPGDLGLRLALAESVTPEYIERMDSVYQHRSSLRLQDLRSDETGILPRRIRDVMIKLGGGSLLFTPFGIGRELLGGLTLLRTESGRPWTPAEISAVESLATDVGRGLDHARLYAQAKDLVEKLKDVDRAKSDFLAAVSHDLKAPLTSIVGYAEMLGEGDGNPLDASQQQMLGAIERNATRLRALIDDVLTMSKIELGSFETVLHPVDLAEVVSASVEDIGSTAAEKRVDLELCSLDAGLIVAGDQEQLDRVLTNLLSNAVKYTPAGGSVHVTAGRDDDQAVVTICDTGIGIPEQDQQSLFTRFFRASNAVTSSITGTGLGLAIVRTIVDNHRGEVELSSQEGEGTTVIVRLPLQADARRACGLQAGSPQADGPHAGGAPSAPEVQPVVPAR